MTRSRLNSFCKILNRTETEAFLLSFNHAVFIILLLFFSDIVLISQAVEEIWYWDSQDKYFRRFIRRVSLRQTSGKKGGPKSSSLTCFYSFIFNVPDPRFICLYFIVHTSHNEICMRCSSAWEHTFLFYKEIRLFILWGYSDQRTRIYVDLLIRAQFRYAKLRLLK